MTEKDFDKCPSCGSFGTYGLRCHPKFSVCYAGTTDGDPDMHMAYFHTQNEADRFAAVTQDEVLYKQKFTENYDKSKSGWEEYH